MIPRMAGYLFVCIVSRDREGIRSKCRKGRKRWGRETNLHIDLLMQAFHPEDAFAVAVSVNSDRVKRTAILTGSL